MSKQKIFVLIAVIATLLMASASLWAGEPLAKRGTYTGKYGMAYSGTPHVIEEGHLFIHDIYKGTFFNDDGEGFLHEASVVCPGLTELVQGKGTAHGYCICTDKEGDKAVFIWKGKIDPATGFNGDFQWTGGTGKYTGIQGNNTFRASLIGKTTQGFGIWRGEWSLP